MFDGVIPQSSGNLSKLSVVSLQKNYLQGSIPSSLWNSQNLNYMYVHQNNPSGAVPKDLFEGSPHPVELTLDDN